MNNYCFSIYHTSWITSGPKSNFICENIATKAFLFSFSCSEVNSTWLITSELANQMCKKYSSLVWYILKVTILLTSILVWETVKFPLINDLFYHIVEEKTWQNQGWGDTAQITNYIFCFFRELLSSRFGVLMASVLACCTNSKAKTAN